MNVYSHHEFSQPHMDNCLVSAFERVPASKKATVMMPTRPLLVYGIQRVPDEYSPKGIERVRQALRRNPLELFRKQPQAICVSERDQEVSVYLVDGHTRVRFAHVDGRLSHFPLELAMVQDLAAVLGVSPQVVIEYLVRRASEVIDSLLRSLSGRDQSVVAQKLSRPITVSHRITHPQELEAFLPQPAWR